MPKNSGRKMKAWAAFDDGGRLIAAAPAKWKVDCWTGTYTVERVEVIRTLARPERRRGKR